MINNKELEKRILKLSMVDTVKNSLIALPLVMLLEIYMIISWIVNVVDKSSAGSLAYLVGYIALLTFTSLVLVFILKKRKRIDQNYRKINYTQHLLAFAYIVWALSFTYVGSELRGHFDYLIFITFVTLLPLFCYLNPIYWTFLQLTGTGCMIYMASHHDRFFAFFINYTVFTIISVAAGWRMYRIRRSAYQRQIELEVERNYAYDLAHKDSLTGLPNRQCCNENLDKLKSDPHREDIIILMCDVDGLKPVNDQQGHEAGDELLKGAADCLQSVFHRLGTIYRVGGDEFTGILHGTEKQLEEALQKFELTSKNWKGKNVKKLSVSIGYASVRSNPTASLASLLTQADNAMYEAKRQHYQKGSKDQ